MFSSKSFTVFDLFFLKLFIYLFIFGCTGSSLLCSGFLWLQRAGPTLHCGAQAPHCGGLSTSRTWAPGARASAVVASVVVASAVMASAVVALRLQSTGSAVVASAVVASAVVALGGRGLGGCGSQAPEHGLSSGGLSGGGLGSCGSRRSWPRRLWLSGSRARAQQWCCAAHLFLHV